MPLHIIRQDITKMKVDAIVNTTNEKLVGLSGVDLAVHQGAGPKLDAACAKLAPLGLGSAKITKGYNLPAKYIIHTSGPVWRGGLHGESIILKSCYVESLKLAVDYKFKTVAFPLISSGTYGYPKDQVLKFALQVISEFLYNHELTVYICVFDRTSYEFSKELFNELSEIIDSEGAVCVQAERSVIPADNAAPPEIKIPSAYVLSPTSPNAVRAHPCGIEEQSLHEYMQSMDKSFAYKLFDFIDRQGMTDVECYKKANVDKKTFSKIKCNPDKYKPSKATAVAFAIALKLNLEETQDLLASAGLTLSQSFTFDKIIRYFIQKGIYDIFEINEALFEFDQVLLG